MGSLVLKRLLTLRSITMKFLVVLAVSVACVAAAPTLLSYGLHSPLTYAAHEVVHHVPQTVSYVAPVQTRVHYETKPVVVGHSTQILKPALGAAATLAVATPTVEVVKRPCRARNCRPRSSRCRSCLCSSHHPCAHPRCRAHSPVVNLKAAIPAGDAPPPSELVQTEKVLAPVRASSKITPELTVQLPTKVNVEKVAVDVPVAAPYAHPVPVPVTTHHHVGVATHTHISAHPTLLTH